MASVTIKDVAKLANVSTTTVSHVINETRYVDPETKARVQAILEELGYQPNILARSLRSGVTKMLGLIVPDASNLFFAEIARKIEDIGFNHGYSVVLCNSDNDPTKQTSYVNTLIERKVDGVIIISSGDTPDDLNRLVANRIPVVVADRDVSLQMGDVVLIDNEKGGYDATAHLVSLGHKRIACISGPNDLTPSRQRVDGYLRCLKENGIKADKGLIEMGRFDFLSGKQSMARLLALEERPSATFVANDMMAIGAMAAAYEAGIAVPEELSIIGFDDIGLASVSTPALTTMAQPIDGLAEEATRLLFARLKKQDQNGNQRVVLDARLIKRASTAKLNGVRS